MQRIGTGGAEQQWSSKIIAQLGFIKKHLRYPISRQTIIPVVFLAASMPLIGFLMCSMFFSKSTNAPKHYWVLAIIVFALFIPLIVAVRRYIQTLRFVAVPARLTVAENMALLIQF